MELDFDEWQLMFRVLTQKDGTLRHMKQGEVLTSAKMNELIDAVNALRKT